MFIGLVGFFVFFSVFRVPMPGARRQTSESTTYTEL